MDIIVGTAGHIDHGKTALVKALTGVDADRLPEEKQRGITIDFGFAELDLGDLRIGFVDVPGHERFVKNMLAGASGIDFVVLVIASDEGVMPQTREHFEICRLLETKNGLIVLTKKDLVDEELLELVKMETAELVENSFLENAPVVVVSAKTGEGIEELKRVLLRNSRRTIPARKNETSRVCRLTAVFRQRLRRGRHRNFDVGRNPRNRRDGNFAARKKSSCARSANSRKIGQNRARRTADCRQSRRHRTLGNRARNGFVRKKMFCARRRFSMRKSKF